MKKFTTLVAAALTTAVICAGSAVSAAAFSFEDLAQTDFAFSSGAGGWATEMEIAADGTFSGVYYDSDMGDGGDGYDATVYKCNFQGSFVNLTQVSSIAYEANITDVKIKNTNGSTEIKDRTRYVYSLPYGLLTEDGDKPASKVTFYMKGTPISEVPASYEQWSLAFSSGNSSVLEDYCILNNDTDTWFIGYAKENTQTQTQTQSESAGAESAYPEPWNTKLNNAISQAAQLETDMETGDKQYYATQLYYVWDDLLNEIWQAYSTDTQNMLMSDEIAWIHEKESRQASYGNSWEGTLLAAQMTRDRVYVLLQYV